MSSIVTVDGHPHFVTGVRMHEEPMAALVLERNGAGDGDRTRDIELGKLAFYR